MVYVETATRLVAHPAFSAIARMVVVAPTEIGSLYTFEVSLGTVPSVVYRIWAPVVETESVTILALV